MTYGAADDTPRAKSKSSIQCSVILALLFCQLIFAGWPVVVKTQLHTYASVFVFYRMCGGAFFFFFILIMTEGQIRAPPEVSCLHLIALGFLTMTNCLAFLLAIERLGVFLPTVGESLIPVVVAVVSAALGLEKFTFKKTLGICCAVIGAMIMVVYNELESVSHGRKAQEEESWGFFCVVSDIVTTASFLAIQKRLLVFMAPLQLMAYGHSIGAVCIGAYAFSAVPFSFKAWSLDQGALTALWYTNLETMICFWLMCWALVKSSPTVCSLSSTLQPMFTAIIQVVVLGTFVTRHDALGAVLAIGGLTMTLSESGTEEVEGTLLP